MPSCQSASTVCVGGSVFECVQGQVGREIDACDQACSLGRCTTAACAAAEQSDAARGCLFYAVQMDNIDSDDFKKMLLLATNASESEPATVAVEERGLDGWDMIALDVAPPRGASRFRVALPAREAGITPRGALRISSDLPIMAAQIISDDGDGTSMSSSGTVLLPAQALGTSHLALTFLESPSVASAAALGSRGGAGVIAIVGTVDGTNVHWTSSSPALVSSDPQPLPAMAHYDTVLNDGDVLQVFSSGGDLTGSEISSDRPVAVLSGNIFTTYGNEPSGFNGGDMAVEQLPPTANWSTTYIGARLAPEAGCDAFFGPDHGYWQLLASQDDTTVTLSPSPGSVLDLQSGVVFKNDTTFGMKRGQSRIFSTYPDPDPNADPNAALPAGPATPTGDFVVVATHPVLLAQWMDCQPSLSFGVDARFGDGDVVMAFPPGFEQEVLITRRKGAPVQFDQETLPDSLFRSASVDGAFEVARLEAKDLGQCLDTLEGCQHVVSGLQFGASWRGMDIVCSYALTVPPRNICVLPAAGCVP